MYHGGYTGWSVPKVKTPLYSVSSESLVHCDSPAATGGCATGAQATSAAAISGISRHSEGMRGIIARRTGSSHARGCASVRNASRCRTRHADLAGGLARRAPWPRSRRPRRARTPESFAQRADDRVADTTVAVVDGDIAGFTMVTGDELERIYVSRAHRGSGIAAQLLDDARRTIGDAGHPVAWLAVATGNKRARRFYERCGWTDEGEFDYAAATDTGSTPVPCHRYTSSTQRLSR
jgi:GNAT superfamily N-acetyltransferase